jgi:hypothetical protein
VIDPDVELADTGSTPDFINPEEDVELLMFALPHHQVRVRHHAVTVTLS